DGTRRLLDAVQPRSRVVYASSAMAADASPKRGDACGRQAYANAKRAAEMLVDAHAQRGASGISLRLQALAGAHRTPVAGLIGVALRAARDGTSMQISQSAPPREYLHIADAAAAVVAACLTPFEGYTVLDVGSGHPHSVPAVVAAAERVTGRSIAQQSSRPRVEPAPKISNLANAAQLLDWRPRRSGLHQIVADQWEDMRRHDLRNVTLPTESNQRDSR
ncbi:MAG: NAD-dependent epimerase/dehydratase family protein, partial [Myxococcota bacterium]